MPKITTLNKFKEAVKARCKATRVKYNAGRVEACWDEGLTVTETLSALRSI